MKNTPIVEMLSIEDAGKAIGLSRSAAYAAARQYRKTHGAEGLPNLKVVPRNDISTP